MGVVRRQGLKNSIISYIGVAIGLLSVVFVYPLDPETYGLAQFIISAATLGVPIVSLGINEVIIRYFPDFRNEKNGNEGYFGMLFLSIIVSISIFGLLFFLFRNQLYTALQNVDFDVQLYKNNGLFIGIICVCLVLITFLTNWVSNFKRIVVPVIFNNLFLKIGLPLLILAIYNSYINLWEFKKGLVGIYVFGLVGLGFYAHYLGGISFKINRDFLKPSLIRNMRSYALYSMLGAFGSIIAFKIDGIMVPSLINTEANGIYMIIIAVASIILIPFKSISAISVPLIADHFSKNNLTGISDLYKKSTNTLLTIGLFIFIAITISAEDIFSLTSKKDLLMTGQTALYIICLAKLIDITAGLNSQIIAQSKFFRYNLIFILILSVLNIGMNFYFIPTFGITGAAIATGLSILIFNIIKFLFIYFKLSLQPFRINELYILLIGGVAFTILYLIPFEFHPIINIVLQGLGTIVLFVMPVLILKLSPEINELIRVSYNQIFRRR